MSVFLSGVIEPLASSFTHRWKAMTLLILFLLCWVLITSSTLAYFCLFGVFQFTLLTLKWNQINSVTTLSLQTILCLSAIPSFPTFYESSGCNNLSHNSLLLHCNGNRLLNDLCWYCMTMSTLLCAYAQTYTPQGGKLDF